MSGTNASYGEKRRETVWMLGRLSEENLDRVLDYVTQAYESQGGSVTPDEERMYQEAPCSFSEGDFRSIEAVCKELRKG